MSAPPTPEVLRARARALRTTATLVERCGVDGLVVRAGPDTWIGPTPSNCLADLCSARTTLATAVDELRAAAFALECQAATLSATTRVLLS